MNQSNAKSRPNHPNLARLRRAAMPLLAVAACEAFAASAAHAVAITYTWTGTSNANWASAANWTPSTNFPGSVTTDLALFNNSGNSNTTILGSGASYTFASMTFDNTAGTLAAYTIGGNTTGTAQDTLTFTGTASAGITSGLIMDPNVTTAVTINDPVIFNFNSNLVVENFSPSAPLTFNNTVSDTFASGVLSMGGDTTFNGVISGSTATAVIGLMVGEKQGNGFSSIIYPFPVIQQYPGTVTFTAANTYGSGIHGVFTTVQSLNTLMLTGNGSIANTANDTVDISGTLAGALGGTLKLDYSGVVGNATINRVDDDSPINFGSQSELILNGNSGASVNETIGSFTHTVVGNSYLTIPTANTTLTMEGVGAVAPIVAAADATYLFRGPSFAASIGNGPVILNTAVGATLPVAAGGSSDGSVTGSFASAGTPYQAVLQAVVGDSSATGYGIGFTTLDLASGNNRVRLLLPSEYVDSSSSLATATNVGAPNWSASGNNASTTVASNLFANTVLINSGTTVTVNTGANLNVSYGILSTGSMPNTIAGPGTMVLGGIEMIYTANDLTLGSGISAYCRFDITKSGPDTLNLASTGAVTCASGDGMDINQGTMRLGANNGILTTTLGVYPTVRINQGAYFDLNGYTQTLAGLTAGAGLVTNTSGTPSTLTITGSAPSISALVAGNINLVTDPGAGNIVTAANYLVNNGTVQVNSGIFRPATFLGCGGAVILGNGSTGTELDVNKASLEIPNGLTDPAGLGLGSGTGIVTSIATGGASNVEIDVASGVTTTFAGSILNPSTGSVAIFKTGQGTQSFTAATASTFTGTITAAGGNLTFDYTTNNNAHYGTSVPLTFNGGTLNYLGNSAGTTQTSTGTMTVNGTGSQLNVTASGSNATAIIFNTLAVTANAAVTVATYSQALTSNGTINFNPVNGGGGGVATVAFNTTPTLANGVLGSTGSIAGYATFGNSTSGYNWATYTGSGSSGAVSPYNETTGVNAGGALAGSGDLATKNYTAASNISVTANDAANTLQINGGSSTVFAANTTTFDGANAGGVMYTGSGAYSIGSVVHNGILGENASTAAAALYIQNFGGNLTINSDIAALYVAYGGTGTVTLTGSQACSTSGMVMAVGGGGIVDVQNASALSNSTHAASFAVSSGSTLQLDGGITTLANATLDLAGAGATVSGSTIGALSSINGSNTVLGNIICNQDLSFMAASGSTLTLAGFISDGTSAAVGEHSSPTIGGAGNVDITGTLATGYGSPYFGLRGVTKVGTGTLTLSGANLFAGGLTIDAGLVNINSDAALSSPLSGASGTSSVNYIQAPLNFNAGANNTVTLQLAASFNLNAARIITLQSGNARIDTQGFTATIGSNINGPGSLEKYGSGMLTLTGDNDYTGGTTLTAGTLVLASNDAFPLNTAANVSSGAQLTIASHASSIDTSIPQMSILNNSGTIDITNNALLVHNGSVGTINGQVAVAYNGGGWNGTSAGGVITSSTAGADATHLSAVGVATGLNTFEGASVATTDVLVKYTYYGDTDLNGEVDGTDYSRIDNAYLYNQTAITPLTGWFNGDFNYDNVINGSDYTLIDNAFNSQGAQIEGVIAGPSAVVTDQIAGGSGISAVPEPTILSLLGIGAVGLLGRRRRR